MHEVVSATSVSMTDKPAWNLLHALQLLPDSSITACHAIDGDRHCRSRLVFGRNYRLARREQWLILFSCQPSNNLNPLSTSDSAALSASRRLSMNSSTAS